MIKKNRGQNKMNEKVKPKKCAEKDCNNKAYGINRLDPIHFEWVCRKHYYDFNYGITYRYWAKDRK